jgi:transposase InsO family protein
VWDYKGQFRLGNRQYCYPLTTSDLCSRFLLATEALDGTDEEAAREVFEEVFEEYGIPDWIRSDNGVPVRIAGSSGAYQVVGLVDEVGDQASEDQGPAHPQENGCHERMHRTLKAETTRPARQNSLQQQERFDEFRQEFNHDRPHEVAGDEAPGRGVPTVGATDATSVARAELPASR